MISLRISSGASPKTRWHGSQYLAQLATGCCKSPERSHQPAAVLFPFTARRAKGTMRSNCLPPPFSLATPSSIERRARKRHRPPSRSHLAGGRRAGRRTGLAFQRLGSRPHRPDDLGDGSPRHHSRLLPNRRARAQQSTPLLKLGWATVACGGSKNKRRERIESTSAMGCLIYLHREVSRPTLLAR